MSLAPGTRLGPYEIVAPLGAGGMGEVYRARDTRLDRSVAVKVLPEHLSLNPEVRARFEREARAVSSLNHPHICTLHDVGHQDGVDYLVMELLEGETLAQRLERGALPTTELLRSAIEIADALDRAHRSGIVHRDLKPGNIMLTRGGAKLMDFGLARATGLAPTTSDLTSSPTVSHPLTAQGTIVGTYQYMAPEQLEGKEADARTDLFSFGAVLYEMATGRRAFEGKSQASLIGAIMNSEPAAVTQVAPLAPPGLERVIRACLAKDAEQRIQTAHDVKLQLQWIAEGGSQAGVPAPVAAKRRSRERVAWAVAAVATLGALALAVPAMRPFLSPPRAVQLSLTAPEGTHVSGYWSGHAISPDGHLVVFSAFDSSGAPQLWLRPLDSPNATLLPGTRTATSPFWSPDSRFIAFFSGDDGKLKKISVSGETQSTICDAKLARGGTWGCKGVIVFAPVPQGPLFQVREGGGDPVQATVLDSTRHEIGQRFPCFLPDGEHFLFASLPPGPRGWDIYLGSLKTKSVKKIMTARSSAVYIEPGYLVFMRDGKIMAQRFDLHRLAVVGDPVALADAPAPTDTDAEAVASASSDGRLVLVVSRVPDARLEWRDRAGAVLGTISLPKAPWQVAALSPDARFAAVVNGDDIWRVDLARSVAMRLTSNGASNYAPVWSPDGRWIAYSASRAGREETEVVEAGGGEPRRIETTGDLFKNPCDWSPDGKTLVFADLSPSTGYDLWTVPIAGDGKAAPFLRTPFYENFASLSPDGDWIAYRSDESGHPEICVQSFPSPGHKVQVSTGGGNFPGWVRGGAEVAYSGLSGDAVMSVPVKAVGGELQPGEPHVLFKGLQAATGAVLSRDGERMLVSIPAAEAQGTQLRVVLGWTALMKR